MGSWEASTSFEGDPQRVIDLLTDPGAARSWSPIDFELEELEGDRLKTGAVGHIAGRMGGRRMSFDIEVLKASDGEFALYASGPVEIEVEYGVDSAEDGSGELTAWISVSSGGGLIGRLAAKVTDGVLAAGALKSTVAQIAAAAEQDAPPAAG